MCGQRLRGGDMTKPEESALRFSNCADICMIVEGVNDCLHCTATGQPKWVIHRLGICDARFA